MLTCDFFVYQALCTSNPKSARSSRSISSGRRLKGGKFGRLDSSFPRIRSVRAIWRSAMDLAVVVCLRSCLGKFVVNSVAFTIL